MSFDAAKALAQEVTSLSESERQLQGLETQIRRLGPVNLAAIDQFNEVNNRRDFLNTQKDDLLNAKALLEATIDEMDDEVKVKFKTTFEAIRLAFKTNFTQMFGGGQADLILNSENLLAAGIEIDVQPPGKKLASLNLMSGGEKSLTALALLFSIIRVRTVPFVVLDEVEAALDEANVKRFGDYMTRFDENRSHDRRVSRRSLVPRRRRRRSVVHRHERRRQDRPWRPGISTGRRRRFACRWRLGRRRHFGARNLSRV